MAEIIVGSILFLLSGVAFWICIRSFQNRGFLFNNAYLYASKKERETMDKKPHYRQSAIVFLIVGIILLLNAIAIWSSAYWLTYAAMVLVAAALIYAIGSGAAMEKKKKNNANHDPS